MSHVQNIFTKLILDDIAFANVIRGMNEAGMQSIVWQSRLALLNNAGITDLTKEVIEWVSHHKIGEKTLSVYRADIFIDGSSLVYVINDSVSFSNHTKRIEIGVISKKEEDQSALLKQYKDAFNLSVKKHVDGRKLRYMQLEWYRFPNNDTIDSYVNYDKQFTYPKTSQQNSEAARLFSSPSNGQLLRKIAERGLLRLVDFESDLRTAIKESTHMLLAGGLIEQQWVLTCRKTSNRIGYLPMSQVVDNDVQFGARCPHCAREFKDELLQEGYCLSDLGKLMNKSSHWMTVLLTDALLAHGIPREGIIWNLCGNGEEVDCVVQYKGRKWIFELKDGDFESGHAHPLMYRSIKFNASRLIIFTTGKVTVDARKIFEDLSRAGQWKFNHNNLHFIEGIESLDRLVKILANNDAIQNLQGIAKRISHMAGIDLSPVFSHHLGNYFHIHHDQSTEALNIFRW